MLKLKCKDNEEFINYFFGNNCDHEVIYKNIVNSIELAHHAKEDIAHFAEITFVYGDTINLAAQRDDWLENLTCALRYYESNEQYEKCRKIVKLIDKIST
jgi:hypothetical protein